MARATPPPRARWPAPDPSRPRPPAPGQRLLVFRRCQVCEWEGDSVETSGADPECPWCHAPTVRAGPALAAEPASVPPGEKNPFAAALGRLGGRKGGRARAARLSAKRRREIAQKAARARWKKK